MQDGNLQAMGAAIQDRMDTIAEVRGAYGPGVQVHPMLPQESKMLANAMQALPSDQLNPLFGTLRQSIGTDDAYKAVQQRLERGDRKSLGSGKRVSIWDGAGGGRHCGKKGHTTKRNHN